MQEEAKVYSLITGASNGIGKALALECASRGMNVILVALPGKELEDAAKEVVETYGVDAPFLGTDLSDRKCVTDLFEWIQENNYSVNMLINNVGVGYTGPFSEADWEISETILSLNMYPMVRLTYLFIPFLKKHPKSYILNLGSLISFHPTPYKSLYSATKSFVHIFSRGLREELKPTSIQVSALFPTGVETNPEVTKRIRAKGRFGQFAKMTAARVAKVGIEKMLAGRYRIIPGKKNQFFYRMITMVPQPLQQWMLARAFGSQEPG